MIRSIVHLSTDPENSTGIMSGRPKGITQQLQHIVQLEKRKGEATEFRKGALQLE